MNTETNQTQTEESVKPQYPETVKLSPTHILIQITDTPDKPGKQDFVVSVNGNRVEVAIMFKKAMDVNYALRAITEIASGPLGFLLSMCASHEEEPTPQK